MIIIIFIIELLAEIKLAKCGLVLHNGNRRLVLILASRFLFRCFELASWQNKAVISYLVSTSG